MQIPVMDIGAHSAMFLKSNPRNRYVYVANRLNRLNVHCIKKSTYFRWLFVLPFQGRLNLEFASRVTVKMTDCNRVRLWLISVMLSICVLLPNAASFFYPNNAQLAMETFLREEIFSNVTKEAGKLVYEADSIILTYRYPDFDVSYLCYVPINHKT